METGKPVVHAVDAYLASFPGEVRKILAELRAVIRAAAPQAQECMAYGMPTFALKGNLVHFAAHKNHIGFYPAPSGIEKFKDELAGYETSKGAVRFPLDRPLPYDLIRRMVAFRGQENLEKAGGQKEKMIL